MRAFLAVMLCCFCAGFLFCLKIGLPSECAIFKGLFRLERLVKSPGTGAYIGKHGPGTPPCLPDSSARSHTLQDGQASEQNLAPKFPAAVVSQYSPLRPRPQGDHSAPALGELKSLVRLGWSRATTKPLEDCDSSLQGQLKKKQTTSERSKQNFPFSVGRGVVPIPAAVCTS